MTQNILCVAARFSLPAIFLLACSPKENIPDKIDRLKLVSRHNVVLNRVDTMGSLSVGNGEFAFTVDASIESA